MTALLPAAAIAFAILVGLALAIGLVGRRGSAALYVLCAVVAAVLLAIDIAALAVGASTLLLPFGLPGTGVHLRLDPLSGFFGLVVNLGACLTSLFAIGYGRHESDRLRVLPFYPAFLAAMNLVLLADDAFSFLVAWELMSLVSWGLVIAHHRNAENRAAGYLYLLMANVGTMALLFAFGVLAGAGGGYDFDAIRQLQRPVSAQSLVLLMTLVGAGSKAGLIPLHVWLPLAHPAAPSHVSALMSGVMTKVAIYALVRILFDLCGPTPWWWAVPLLLTGSATAVLGVLYAMLQQNLKKLLAFSTIENIGVITVALGLALAFRAGHMIVAAAVALTAALLHVLNHSLFKNLLFLGSGAVLHASNCDDIDQMGGLIHRLPVTAWVFLTGCAAAAALPPLNGFVSEWMLFQAILVSPDIPQALLRFIIPAVGALLALAAALAASCFVRLFGITFLGRARSPAAADARETDRFSLAAMIGLALLCGLTGLFAAALAERLAPVTLALVGGALPPQQAGPAPLSLTPFSSAHSSYNAPLLLLFMVISASLTGWGVHLLASRRTRRTAAWDCGYPDASPRLQPSGSGFAQPIRRLFASLLFRARDDVTMPIPGEMDPAVLRTTLSDPVWDTLYAPTGRAVLWAADRLNRIQYLTIRQYLGFTFVLLILLLVVVAIWQT